MRVTKYTPDQVAKVKELLQNPEARYDDVGNEVGMPMSYVKHLALNNLKGQVPPRAYRGFSYRQYAATHAQKELSNELNEEPQQQQKTQQSQPQPQPQPQLQPQEEYQCGACGYLFNTKTRYCGGCGVQFGW